MRNVTASLTRGKLSVCDGLVVSEDTIIPALDNSDSYKYLGTFELDQIKEKHMKEPSSQRIARESIHY